MVNGGWVTVFQTLKLFTSQTNTKVTICITYSSCHIYIWTHFKHFELYYKPSTSSASTCWYFPDLEMPFAVHH